MTDRSAPEPIEEYLDNLLVHLRLPPRNVRRLLAETEAHLLETAASLRAQGMAAVDSEREAVRRFGTAADVGASASAARRPSGAEILGHVAQSCLTLVGVGLAAIGVSGGLVALSNAALGARFVGALRLSTAAAPCRYYLAIHPGAATCAQATMWENSQDAVTLRVLAGLVGVVLLLAAWLWRRAFPGARTARAIRDGITAAVAALAFGAGAVFLVGMSIALFVQHGSNGIGFYLSGGVVAAIAAVISAFWAHRRLKHLGGWRLRRDLLDLLVSPST